MTVCIFCDESKGDKVHTSGGFVQGDVVCGHYEGVAHPKCIKKYRSWWRETKEKSNEYS